MQEEMQLIMELEKNDKAVRDSFQKIRKLYPNQYIAVDGGKIIFHDANLDLLRKKLVEKKVELLTVLIQYIPEKGVEILY